MEDKIAHWLETVEQWWFDLDGTLIDSAPVHTILLRIAEITDAPLEQLLNHYRNEWRGFEQERTFHINLARNASEREDVVTLYRNFCASHPSHTIRRGSHTVLKLLRKAGKTLVCYTRGFEDIQRAKIDATQLSFDAICVVEKKDVATLKQTVISRRSSAFVMIGNTFTEDIAPAKGIARGRIWVSRGVAAHNHTGMSSDIVVVDSVQDLVMPIRHYLVRHRTHPAIT